MYKLERKYTKMRNEAVSRNNSKHFFRTFVFFSVSRNDRNSAKQWPVSYSFVFRKTNKNTKLSTLHPKHLPGEKNGFPLLRVVWRIIQRSHILGRSVRGSFKYCHRQSDKVTTCSDLWHVIKRKITSTRCQKGVVMQRISSRQQEPICWHNLSRCRDSCRECPALQYSHT